MVTSSGVLLHNKSVVTLGQRLHYNGRVITFIPSGWQNHRRTHAENMKYRHLQRNILLFHTFIWNNNLHILSCKCFIEEPGIKSSTIQKNKPNWENSIPTLQPWVNQNSKHHTDSYHLIMYIQRPHPCRLICQLLQFLTSTVRNGTSTAARRTHSSAPWTSCCPCRRPPASLGSTHPSSNTLWIRHSRTKKLGLSVDRQGKNLPELPAKNPGHQWV
jgi:hypothetical protein